MNEKQQVFVLRHGETEWSKSGQHTSVTDLPLTEKGRGEATLIRPQLLAHHFAKVLCSPLRRARETCELAGLAAQMEIDEDLHEWRYGEYEGLTTPQIHQRAPGWNVFDGPNPGGESPEQVGQRVDRLLQKVREVDGDVALFGHGHILRAVTSRWLRFDAGAARAFTLKTGTISILGYEHDWPALIVWNVPSDLASAYVPKQ